MTHTNKPAPAVFPPGPNQDVGAGTTPPPTNYDNVIKTNDKVKGFQVSFFPAPVTNTDIFTNMGWTELCNEVSVPLYVADNSSYTKKQYGQYFLRGAVNSKRDDENLEQCHLLILDVDKELNGSPLPTVYDSHDALQDIIHIVYTSVTPGRSRIVVPVPPYDKEKTDILTQQLYDYCLDVGLEFSYAGESSTKSQPWFYGQTVVGNEHLCKVNHDGELFKPDPNKVIPVSGPTFAEAPRHYDDTNNHNPTKDFIEGLQSGTIHDVVKRYAGWKSRTSNLSMKQIFDEITAIIDTNCSDSKKVNRWRKNERQELEAWFQNKVQPNREQADVYGQDYSQDTNIIDTNKSVEELLEDFTVKQEYVDGLGKEEFIYPDLIIAGQILTLIAMAGGGKTTFMFKHVAPSAVKKGYKVIYADADSPAGEHKWMKKFADDHGFKLINPMTNVGQNIDTFLDRIGKMAAKDVPMRKSVFVFDTLKKFADIQNKNKVKEFFILCRKLTALGATLVFLGHAKKYRNHEGFLIPDGTGDVTNDSDTLIFLEHVPAFDGINVTTVVDQNKGAKVRGLFKAISFNISKSRDVTLLDNVVVLPDRTQTRNRFAEEDEIVQATIEVLTDAPSPIKKMDLVDIVRENVTGNTGASRVRKIISQHAEDGGVFDITTGDKNAHFISLRLLKEEDIPIEAKLKQHLPDNVLENEFMI